MRKVLDMQQWVLASLVFNPHLHRYGELASRNALYNPPQGILIEVVKMILREELDGYAAYSQKVRFKLLPGIW